MVLQWCHSGVTAVLQWCLSGITVVLQGCYLVFPHAESEVQARAQYMLGRVVRVAVEKEHITIH
jgi:hypothetical protein